MRGDLTYPENRSPVTLAQKWRGHLRSTRIWLMGEPAPLRADAERNRQRILDAAREVFADRGLDVTLDEIARHAGVGVGTAYRRFPNKEALVEALMVERIGELEQLARECLEQ